MTFTYVPEKQAYLLPITSAIGDYYPKVTQIKRESGNIRRVTVGYCSPFGQSGEFSPSATLEPVKYQDYLFKKDGGNYYLTAIVESTAKAASSAAATMADAGPAVSIAPQEVLDSIAEQLPDDSVPADSVPQADAGEAQPAA